MLVFICLCALSNAFDWSTYYLMNKNTNGQVPDWAALAGAMDSDIPAYLMNGQNLNNIPWYAIDGDLEDYMLYNQAQNQQVPSTSSNHATYDLYGPTNNKHVAQVNPAGEANEDLWKLEAWDHGVDPSQFDSEAEYRMYALMHPSPPANNAWKEQAAAMNLNPNMFASESQFRFFQPVNIRLIGSQPDEKFQDFWEQSAQALHLPLGLVTDDSAKEAAGAWLIGQGFTDIDAFDGAALKMFGYQSIVMQENLKANQAQAAVPAAPVAPAQPVAPAAQTAPQRLQQMNPQVNPYAQEVNEDLWKVDAWNRGVDPSGFDSEAEFRAYMLVHPAPPANDAWKAQAASLNLNPDMFSSEAQFRFYQGVDPRQIGTQPDERFQEYWEMSAQALHLPYGMVTDDSAKESAGAWLMGQGFTDLDAFDDAALKMFGYQAIVMTQNLMRAQAPAAPAAVPVAPAAVPVAPATAPATGSQPAQRLRGQHRQGFNPFDGDAMEYMIYGNFMNGMGFGGANQQRKPQQNMWSNSFSNPLAWGMMDGDWEDMAYMGMFNNMWGGYNPFNMFGWQNQQQRQPAPSNPAGPTRGAPQGLNPFDNTPWDDAFEYQASMNMMNAMNGNQGQGQAGAPQMNPMMFGAMDNDWMQMMYWQQMMNQMNNNQNQGTHHQLKAANPSAGTQANPMSTCLALMAQLKAIDSSDMRDLVVTNAIHQQQIDPMCSHALIENVDSSTLRDQLRMILMNNQNSRQAGAPTSPGAGANPNMDLGLVAALNGDAQDMMIVQMILQNPQMAPALLNEIDSGDLRDIVAAKLMTQAQASAGAAPAASSGAATPSREQTGSPSTATIHPAALMAMINEADGNQQDFMIQQAIMGKQVPSYMFPALLKQMDNGDLRDQLSIYLLSLATSSQMPTGSRAAAHAEAGATGPTSAAADHQNMAQILMLLNNIDSGTIRDSYVAKMIMENSVPSYMFPELMEQIDNGDIKDQIQMYIMTQGSQGGVNPAGVGFVDGSTADFYASQAVTNSNGAVPPGFMPFMDGDIQENMQQQMLWSSIQNNGAPLLRKQHGGASPCMNPMTMNKGAFFQTFPMMRANPNCFEADMTDCCDDLMQALQYQQYAHAMRPQNFGPGPNHHGPGPNHHSGPGPNHHAPFNPQNTGPRSRVERKL